MCKCSSVTKLKIKSPDRSPRRLRRTCKSPISDRWSVQGTGHHLRLLREHGLWFCSECRHLRSGLMGRTYAKEHAGCSCGRLLGEVWLLEPRGPLQAPHPTLCPGPLQEAMSTLPALTYTRNHCKLGRNSPHIFRNKGNHTFFSLFQTETPGWLLGFH